MVRMSGGLAKRRGAGVNPPNRYERIRLEADPEHGERDSGLRILPTEVYADSSRSVVTEVKSPDLRFRFSLNPYRGCEHGCTYCYARPTHEMLGWSAGVDFETKIMAKPEAHRLLREFLRSGKHDGEPITLSGVTDPYQPIERRMKITRGCLEVFLEEGHPVEILTKNRLILRDLDLLEQLAKRRLVHATLAITTLDEPLQHEMEPRASSPLGRLDVMRQLTAIGVPVRVLLAPLIPGLTDSEMPGILKAARLCGATSASYVVLRLPAGVKEVFLDWLERSYPERAARVKARIRELRGGRWNDPRFGTRMTGTGRAAEDIAKLFAIFTNKYGLNRPMPPFGSSEAVGRRFEQPSLFE